MKRRSWRRRLFITSGVGVGILIVLWQLGPMAAAPYVRAKLQAMISEQLDAELTMGRLAYHPPFGVSVRDARLTARDGDGGAGRATVDLLTARTIDLKLARHPFQSGPLVIERLEIDSPAVRIVRTTDGVVGRGIGKSDARPGSERRKKLSEMLELRHVRLDGGSVVYEDRVTPGAVPPLWHDLTIDLATAPQSAAEYAYQFTAGDGKIASLSAEGSVNIDDLLLRLTKCAIRTSVDPAAKNSPLPGEIQRVLREYAVGGEVTLTVTGEVPLMDMARAKLNSTIELARATGRIKGAEAPLDELDVKLAATVSPVSDATRQRIVNATIERVIARGRDVAVRIDGADVVWNSASGAIGVSDLKLACDTGADRAALPVDVRKLLDELKVTGAIACTISGSGPARFDAAALNEVQAEVQVSPKDLTIHHATLPDPLHDIGDLTLRLAGGVMTAQTVRARYGNDVVFVREAKAPIKDLPRAVRFEQLAGAITFADPHAKYPPAIAEYLAKARPRGPFFFDGTAHLEFDKPNPAVDYRMRVTSERAAVSTAWHHIPLTNVAADLIATPAFIDISKFNADALTGKLATVGRIDLAGDSNGEPTYTARVRIRRMDLNRLAELLVEPGGEPITVSGEVSSDLSLSGRSFDVEKALDALTAEGALEIDRGDLFHVPVLKDVAEKVRLGNAGTVGEAACGFKLAARRIQLTDAAIGAPAVGVRGGGSISFDGSLDLEVIATGLNDWEKHIRRDDNPIANVAGAIAGTVQKGLNSVTKELLYRMHVVGTVEKPDVRVVAAPVVQRRLGN
ncbi:MAG: AsmA-like C-terminal region-containing protein [Tepidisphaeraceae bacterium]